MAATRRSASAAGIDPSSSASTSPPSRLRSKHLKPYRLHRGAGPDYGRTMSRGRRRLRRLILQTVNSTRYGCTVGQLAYQCYDVGREAGPTEAQLAAVDRAVRLLLDDGRVVERTMLGTQPCLF